LPDAFDEPLSTAGAPTPRPRPPHRPPWRRRAAPRSNGCPRPLPSNREDVTDTRRPPPSPGRLRAEPHPHEVLRPIPATPAPRARRPGTERSGRSPTERRSGAPPVWPGAGARTVPHGAGKGAAHSCAYHPTRRSRRRSHGCGPAPEGDGGAALHRPPHNRSRRSPGSHSPLSRRVPGRRGRVRPSSIGARDDLHGVGGATPTAAHLLHGLRQHGAFLDLTPTRQFQVKIVLGADGAGHVETGEVAAPGAPPPFGVVRHGDRHVFLLASCSSRYGPDDPSPHLPTGRVGHRPGRIRSLPAATLTTWFDSPRRPWAFRPTSGIWVPRCPGSPLSCWTWRPPVPAPRLPGSPRSGRSRYAGARSSPSSAHWSTPNVPSRPRSRC